MEHLIWKRFFKKSSLLFWFFQAWIHVSSFNFLETISIYFYIEKNNCNINITSFNTEQSKKNKINRIVKQNTSKRKHVQTMKQIPNQLFIPVEFSLFTHQVNMNGKEKVFKCQRYLLKERLLFLQICVDSGKYANFFKP